MKKYKRVTPFVTLLALIVLLFMIIFFQNFVYLINDKYYEKVNAEILKNETDGLFDLLPMIRIKYEYAIFVLRTLSFLYTPLYGLNYEVAIRRLQNTEIPLFNDSDYAKANITKNDDNATKKVADIIMEKYTNDKFTFDDTNTIAVNFKEYFLAADIDNIEGSLSDSRFNMTNMYNFCYNADNIERIVNKDKDRLAKSLNNVDQAIRDATNKINQNKSTEEKTEENPVAQSTEQPETAPANDASNNGDADKSGDSAGGESFAAYSGTYFTEADDKTNNKADTTKLQIDAPKNPTTNITKSMVGSNNVNGKEGIVNTNNMSSEELDNLQKLVDTYSKVCNGLFSAKVTAVEQIAKEMMKIIREHVRSYGGKDLDNKEYNKKQDQATPYEDKTQQNNDQNDTQ